MKYYPIFLDICGKPCLVVGGGTVGFRKAGTLEKCGAAVTVVSEKFDDRFSSEPVTRFCLKTKPYESKDVMGMFLVITATDNRMLNSRVQEDAKALGILCNMADAQETSDFILPAVMEQGDLILAVSTCGSSPALAKKIRKELTVQYGPEYGLLLDLMRTVRKKLLASDHAPDDHKEKFHALLNRNILGKIKANDTNAVNQILRDVLGEGYL